MAATVPGTRVADESDMERSVLSAELAFKRVHGIGEHTDKRCETTVHWKVVDLASL